MEYTHKIVKNDKDETKIEVTVPIQEFEPYKEEAYKILSKDVKIQGFRPGKAPRNMIEAKIGSELVNEAIRRLLVEVSFSIIDEEGFKPISQPDYHLEKFDPKDGISFHFHFTNYPEVKLADFKKIKVEKEEPKIDDEEVDTVIKSIIRSNVPDEKIRELTKVSASTKESPKASKEEGSSKKSKTKKTEEESKKHSTEKTSKNEKSEKPVEDFTLNDELVKELGYEEQRTLKAVRDDVRKRLEDMKKQQVEEKYTNDVVMQLVEKSKFDIPKIMLDTEIKNAEDSFNNRLKDLNLDAKTYLATQGKNLEELKKEWEKQAKDRVGVDLVLINIAMQNDKMPSEKDVEAELKKINDPEAKKKYSTPNGRDYIRMVLARRNGVDLLMESVT